MQFTKANHKEGGEVILGIGKSLSRPWIAPLFSAISAPLSDLTKKGQPSLVRWGEAQEKAFLTLQEILLRKPILRLPDHKKTFIL